MNRKRTKWKRAGVAALVDVDDKMLGGNTGNRLNLKIQWSETVNARSLKAAVIA
jgi:hypothetical protein